MTADPKPTVAPLCPDQFVPEEQIPDRHVYTGCRYEDDALLERIFGLAGGILCANQALLSGGHRCYRHAAIEELADDIKDLAAELRRRLEREGRA